MTKGRLTGVGVGPGDPELVTVRAARLIAEADVVAYHCAPHGNSIARAAAAPYLRPGQAEEVLRYPVTTGGTGHPGGYAGALADFYDEATSRLAAHLEQGRDVVVLCEGDPGFYGSYSICTSACAGGSARRSCPVYPRFRPLPRPWASRWSSTMSR
jgi:precorrin-2 C20-methyltransferase/precorrin-3B C17-methyltransferase